MLEAPRRLVPLTPERRTLRSWTPSAHIFSFPLVEPFDPAVWDPILANLPKGYVIPDPDFVQVLDRYLRS